MSDRFDTMVNSSRLPAARFLSSAYSMMCFTTGKLTSGSPPWNSSVTFGFVVRRIWSTLASAISRVMSVWVASMSARLAWQ